jgi:hypothetical protein
VPKNVKKEPHQARIYRAKISCGDENFKKTGFCAETGKEDRAEYKKERCISSIRCSAPF